MSTANDEGPCVHAHFCGECMDSMDNAAVTTAKKLAQIAITGKHEGVFGSEDIEQAAKTIQTLNRALRALREYFVERLVERPPNPRDGTRQTWECMAHIANLALKIES